MPNKHLRGVLVDTVTCTAKAVNITDSLESFYNALHCDTIDIVSRCINGRRFDIVCDDEARLKEHTRISAVDPTWEAMLFGNLLVVGPADTEGNLTSLTREEVKYVLSWCKPIDTTVDYHHNGRPVRMLLRVTN